MTDEYRSFGAATLQASPVLPMNREATIDRACTLIEEGVKNGAHLVVFPETFVPMYPHWSIDLQNPAEWARNLSQLTKEAIEIPGQETELLGKAAIDTTRRDTRRDILSLNIPDGVYVPYRGFGQPEMVEGKEPPTFDDLMTSMGRMTSKLEDLTSREDVLLE